MNCDFCLNKLHKSISSTSFLRRVHWLETKRAKVKICGWKWLGPLICLFIHFGFIDSNHLLSALKICWYSGEASRRWPRSAYVQALVSDKITSSEALIWGHQCWSLQATRRTPKARYRRKDAKRRTADDPDTKKIRDTRSAARSLHPL